jgi:hypothetical protein
VWDRNDLISTRLSTVEYLLVQDYPVSLRSVEALAHIEACMSRETKMEGMTSPW